MAIGAWHRATTREVSRMKDPLSPARGVVLGVLLGAAIWALVYIILKAVL